MIKLFLLKAGALIFVFLFWRTEVKSQDILLKNPSLEDIPAQGKVPFSWSKGSGTPDIQPGIFNINIPASDGHTFVGLHSGPLSAESIAQEAAMKGGHRYTLSFDMAFTASYVYKACYGNIAIYGGNTPGDSMELLWKSGAFSHTDWKRYNAVFSPSHNYKYISFWADAAIPCEKSDYGSVVLIDNFSSFIREVPQIIISAQNTCKGINNGLAKAKVIGGIGPYTYLWKPGGQTTDYIDKLPQGEYQVTITSSNGTNTTAAVTIKETDLRNEVTTISSACNGDKQNQIIINTTGGTFPYRYYLNGAGSPSYTAVFKELDPGNYSVVVKDEQGCEDKLPEIKLTEPPPLQLTAVNKKDISCSETTDGKIILDMTGGITPYLYKMGPGNWQPESSWNHLDEGRYYFEVKDHNNCFISGSADIFKNQRNCAVFVPTAFSPNGDGQNDLFRVKIHDDVSNYRIIIYNRWGSLVFQSSEPGMAWDGGQQPVGSYSWVLTYTDSKKQARKQLGSLVLIK